MAFFVGRQFSSLLSYLQDVKGADRFLLLRRSILLLTDLLVLALSFWAAFALRLNEIWPTSLVNSLPLLPFLLCLGLGILLFSGWYRSLTRSTGSHSFYSLLPRTALIVLSLALINTLFRTVDPPRSFWFLLWLFSTSGLLLTRVVARDVIFLRSRWLSNLDADINAVIYGAGDAGFRLLQELQYSPTFNIVAFIDDQPNLWNRRILRRPIFPPSSIPLLQESDQVTQVLLAIPSTTPRRRRELVTEFAKYGLKVLSIPSLTDIANGRHRVSELRNVSIEDILGRAPSAPIPGLLEHVVRRQSILVTGAGGSIGSELCRQVMALGASKLILVERSEFALYSIYQELSAVSPKSTELVPALLDASDSISLQNLCDTHNVNTFLHAAAYKHVPLVESNPISAIGNNIKCTLSSLEAARRSRVQYFTLISTDKAVRPTNIMGASKRVCELLVQQSASEIQQFGHGPICSMVRFGNVLGSSGSVVPLFRQQIANGGPVTVTHPEVTRFFMTIPEAVQLVLQATALAKGGDVFLLDMGDPVRIYELARQMIQLSGYTVRDSSTPKGDIAINFTGLRSGEKLYEELLIGNNISDTSHPLICRAQEASVNQSVLSEVIDKLLNLTPSSSFKHVISLLKVIVPDYNPTLDS